MNRLRDWWRGFGEDPKGFVVLGGVVVVAALAILIATSLDGITAALTPETVGERLRRECTSIVMEAYPNYYDQFGPKELGPADYERKARVKSCIMERGKAGR